MSKGRRVSKAELRRQKRAVHIGRGGAKQHMPISEEPLLNVKTPICHQSRCGRARCLCYKKCLGVEEEQQKGRRREAGKLGSLSKAL